ncbi:MAG: discoidin domain-containing protein [Desulfobacterales bacterium]|nr:discoidin domain-containing protein [Desulfobacterales bacterium]
MKNVLNRIYFGIFCIACLLYSVNSQAEYLDRSGWSVTVDSQETRQIFTNSPEYHPTLAIHATDGDPSSFWCTLWQGYIESFVPERYPHWMQINIGRPPDNPDQYYYVNGFKYLPRQDSHDGRIGSYEFYVSIDGSNWGTPVATGNFQQGSDSTQEQEIFFSPKEGQFVKLVALSELRQHKPWAAIAEFNVSVQAMDLTVTPNPLYVRRNRTGIATINGGTAPYNLTNTSSTPSGIATAIIDGNRIDVTGITIGTGTFTVTDTSTPIKNTPFTVIVFEPAALTVTPNVMILSLCQSQTAIVSGGTPPYTVSSDNPIVSATIDTNTITLTAQGESDDTIIVTVQDSSVPALTATITITIGEPASDGCIAISNRPFSGTTTSLSSNANSMSDQLRIFQVTYNETNWSGNMTAYSVNTTTGDLNTTPAWSAQTILDAANPNSRKIISLNGSNGIPFRFDSISSSQQQLLDTNSGIAQSKLNYIRGDFSNEASHGGTLRNRDGHKLGDIVHASPLVKNNIVYVGANDGMLHAFDVTDGTELFAYIPNLVFSHLKELSDPGYSHRYFVDQTPYAKKTETDTFLVGGLGKGGKGYYCLKISTISPSMTESEAANMVQWEYPGPTASEDEKKNIGYSYSSPFIVKSNSGEWVVIFGNGYNSENARAVLYIVKLSDGTLLKMIDTGIGSPSTPGMCNGLSTPALVDIDNNGTVDYVYAGDILGNMWKFDLKLQSLSSWTSSYREGTTLRPLFTAQNADGIIQPITTKPDVVKPCMINAQGYIIVFGTGKYLGHDDFGDTPVQSVYGIWDWGKETNEYLGTFTTDRHLTNFQTNSNLPDTITLLSQSEIFSGSSSGNTVSVMTNNEIDWFCQTCPPQEQGTHVGWYFDFSHSKERVVLDPVIRDGKAIITSLIPSPSPCIAGGTTWLYEIDACNGGRLSNSQFDLNNDNQINDNDLINITISGPQNLVAPTSIQGPTNMLLSTPIIIPMPGTNYEIKYRNQANGSVSMVKERVEQRRRAGWRELN